MLFPVPVERKSLFTRPKAICGTRPFLREERHTHTGQGQQSHNIYFSSFPDDHCHAGIETDLTSLTEMKVLPQVWNSWN